MKKRTEEMGDCASRTGALLGPSALPEPASAVSALPGDDPAIAMPAATLAALRGSIAKWEAIVAGTGADGGSQNCPLCVLFIDDHCAGCPVAAATGRTVCIDTPYTDWTDSNIRYDFDQEGYIAVDRGAEATARRELDFLRSLLPAEARGIVTGGGDAAGGSGERSELEPDPEGGAP